MLSLMPWYLNRQSRRYGVIKCDPLVRQGLDRTVSRPLCYTCNDFLYQNIFFPIMSHFLHGNIFCTGKAYGHTLHAYVDSANQLDWVGTAYPCFL
jgi:hypothetical protein